MLPTRGALSRLPSAAGVFRVPEKFFFLELSGLERLAGAGFQDRAELIS